MRTAAALLAMVALAAAQAPREVASIVEDHCRALGDAARVRTLRAEGSADQGGHAFPDVQTLIDVAGRSVRTMRAPERGDVQVEQYGPEGAFLANAGALWRLRPSQETGRAFYYLQQALAHPFPLLPYRDNPAAQAGLGRAAAEGHEVLIGPRDENGVRALYLLDVRTHLLTNVRYEREQGQPFLTVAFRDHRAVDGVVLHHGLWARFSLSREDVAKKRIVGRALVRSELIARWTLDPDLRDATFAPPAPAAGTAEGFARVKLATGPDPHEVAVGDLDGDGHADVAVACWGAAHLYFGPFGDEGATTRVVPAGEGQLRGAAIDDFDADGRNELLVSSNIRPAETFLLVRVGADRTFATSTIFGAPLFLHDLASVDLDFDGIPDIVSSGWGMPRLDFKFGNGVGGVRLVGSAWPLATSEHPERRGFGLDVGFLDADHLHDVALADGTRVVVFQGEANLSFQPRVSVEAGPRPVDVCFADLNGDGRTDLLATSEHPSQDLPRELAVLLNTGEGLRGHCFVEAGARVPAIACGELDGDGRIDVAAASFLTGGVTLLSGDGEGSFARTETLASGRGTHRLAVADVDGDGRDDIVASNRLDDSISLLLNRRAAASRSRPAPARAAACPAYTDVVFTLEGLEQAYAFAGEFRLPAAIRDPSDLAFLGGDEAHTQLVLLSDKEPSLFRAVLDRAACRLLVGPAIPLRGNLPDRLDLEGVAFDRESGSLFLGCEADSSILRTTLFGHVLGQAPTGIASGGNDGIEAVALRRAKDGTPLLYVFKEREGTTLAQPPVRVFGIDEDPFALTLRLETKLPHYLADQTGAAVAGDRLFVVGRLARLLASAEFDGDGFAPEVRTASFRALTDEALGLFDATQPLFGLVEGVTVDERGDLYLIVDNNGQPVGVEGRNRGPEGRLLWLRCLEPRRTRPEPRRVAIRQLFFASEAGAAEARACYRRAREGEDYEALRAAYANAVASEVRIVAPPDPVSPGELRPAGLQRALARLAFALDVGEVGLCEFHPQESPAGWFVVWRIA